MSTFEAALMAVMIGGGVADWDSVITKIVQWMIILMEAQLGLNSYYELSLDVCLQIS